MKTETKAMLLQHMTLAVENGINHVAGGGLPFAALVVDQAGKIVGRGVNRVNQRSDPTAHAEVEAVRDACDHLTRPRIHGATLLATGEPCALCLMTAAHAGITSIYFAVDCNEAAHHGVDYRTDQYQVSSPHRWSPPIKLEKLTVANRLKPFLLFLELQSKQGTAARNNTSVAAQPDLRLPRGIGW